MSLELIPDFATYKVEMKYDNQLNLSKIRQKQKNTAKKQEGWHMTTNIGSRRYFKIQVLIINIY